MSIIKKKLVDKVFVHLLMMCQLVYRFSPIFLATNLDEKVKNIDYLKIKNFNLVSHVPFIRFLEAINWI